MFTSLGFSFDAIIGPLGAMFRREADTLLDLRECVLKRERPGRCVACYFALQNKAKAEEVMARLCPLRSWLEEQIEVVACDEGARSLESVPLQLAAPDLESYCRGLMTEFQENRVYAAKELQLSFRFKGAAAG